MKWEFTAQDLLWGSSQNGKMNEKVINSPRPFFFDCTQHMLRGEEIWKIAENYRNTAHLKGKFLFRKAFLRGLAENEILVRN